MMTLKLNEHKMWRRLSCLTAVLLAFAVQAEVKTWTGNANGTVDWAVETWSPSAPSAADSAYFPPSSAACYFIVTPPASFVGTILTTNETAYKSDGASNWTQPTYVQLTALDGASWKVDGCGVIVVSNGFTAARVASTFTGVISVPAGLSFEASSSLNDKVEFTGAGTLTITKAEQFSHLSGFSGQLIRSGDALTATVPELTAYQGRTLAVENGGAIALGEDLLTIGATEKMTDFGGAGWSVQSKRTREDFGHYYGDFAGGSPAPAAVNEREYCMVDAPNQDTSAFYTNRLVRMSDDWGMSFDWIVTCPYPSQLESPTWKGQGQLTHFSIVMQNRSPDNLKTMNGSFSCASNVYGMAVYTYLSGANSLSCWRWDSSTYANSSFPPSVQGLDFTSTAKPENVVPIHVTVACVAGRFTYTFEKEGRSMTASRDFSKYLELQGRGVYVGLTASAGGGEAGAYCPWGLTSIRNFRGWIRTREALPRTKNETYSQLTSANYTNENVVVENGAVKTNVNAFTTAGARLTDKSTYNSSTLKYTRGCVVAKYALSPMGRYLITCDVDWGAKTSSLWGGAYFGVVGGRDADFMMSRDVKTRYGIGRTGIGDMDGWCYGIYMPHTISYSGTPSGSLYLNYRKGSTCGRDTSSFKKTTSSSKDVLGGAVSSRARYQLFYDGVGKRAAMDYNRVSTTSLNGGSWSAAMRSSNFDKFVAADCAGTTLRPGYWQGTDGSCIDAVVAGVTVEEISDNANAYVPSVLQIAASRSATVSVASPFPDSATPAATLQGVSLASGAALTVQASTTAAKLAVEGVALSGSSAVSVASGASLKLGRTLVCSSADGAATVSGNVSFADGTLDVTIPQSAANAKRPLTPLNLKSATVSGSLPSTINVYTDLGSNVTARARATFANGVLTLYPPRGMMLIVR